jgi:hypothetical protein
MPAKRNVKYKVKIQINRIERRQVGKAVEPLLVSFFDSLKNATISLTVD